MDELADFNSDDGFEIKGPLLLFVKKFGFVIYIQKMKIL